MNNISISLIIKKIKYIKLIADLNFNYVFECLINLKIFQFLNICSFTILNRTRILTTFLKCNIIIHSALSLDGFINKAISMGAKYYCTKPFDLETLKERVLDFNTPQTRNTSFFNSKEGHKIEEKITNIFITVGIPAHIKGYQFLREAIKLAIINPEIINSITKKLYPEIALKCNSSASKVERAIRHAIQVAWYKGRIENINNIFGVKAYSPNEKPSNGEFIAIVADKMLMEIV